jgi:hypothetical protein
MQEQQRRRWNRQCASVLGCNSDNEPGEDSKLQWRKEEPGEDSKLQWWKEGFSEEKG